MNENIFGRMQKFNRQARYLRDSLPGVKHLNQIDSRSLKNSIVLTVTVELDQAIDRVECLITEPEEQTIPFELADTEWDLLNWAYYQVWQAEIPNQPDDTLVRYQIKAYPLDGGEPIPADGGATFSYLFGEMRPPDWATEAVIYQIFPDRFHPGEGRDWNPVDSLGEFHGGTLRGIIEHLDHIADLGFNCIWLNPIFPDTVYHGYHATDYFSVNPRMGTLEDAVELAKEAHARGIRLLLDFVANHWGRPHPIFQEALADRDSEYYDWFYWREWPDDYATYFDVKELPKINVDHPGARKHLLDSVWFWLGEIGFDGLRLDHANGPSMDFWTELRQAATAVKPDVWIFGEVVEPPANLLKYEGRFHGCLDFALAQALRDTFAYGTMKVDAFDAFLQKNEAFFPSGFNSPSFFDNHDMDRFLWLVEGDRRKLKQAALCLFTLKPAPIIYYGTEVGLSQMKGTRTPDSQGWEECRLPMLWGEEQDSELYEYFKWLVHFRKDHPLLLHGARTTLHVDGMAGTYVYAVTGDEETIMVGLNLSEKEQTIAVDRPDLSIKHTFTLSPWGGDVHVIPLG